MDLQKSTEFTDFVYFEFQESLLAAIAREKAIKQWKRFWKIKLIESINPTWNDLYDTLI